MKIVLGILLLILQNISCKNQNKETKFSQQKNSSGYKIVGTWVKKFYSNTSEISTPKLGEKFYGQGAQYQINAPLYTDYGYGTVTENVTGLMWQKDMGLIFILVSTKFVSIWLIFSNFIIFVLTLIWCAKNKPPEI